MYICIYIYEAIRTKVIASLVDYNISNPWGDIPFNQFQPITVLSIKLTFLVTYLLAYIDSAHFCSCLQRPNR